MHRTDGTVVEVDNPAELPDPQRIDHIEEPYFKVSIITPSDYTGTLMELCQHRRGEIDKIEYLSPERVELHYRMPLAEVVVDFFDQMKSRTQGYASLDYEPAGYRRSNLVQGRPAAQQRAGRRLLHDRAPRPGVRVRAADDREAQGADPAADVRRADPGGDRRAR